MKIGASINGLNKKLFCHTHIIVSLFWIWISIVNVHCFVVSIGSKLKYGVALSGSASMASLNKTEASLGSSSLAFSISFNVFFFGGIRDSSSTCAKLMKGRKRIRNVKV